MEGHKDTRILLQEGRKEAIVLRRREERERERVMFGRREGNGNPNGTDGKEFLQRTAS